MGAPIIAEIPAVVETPTPIVAEVPIVEVPVPVVVEKPAVETPTPIVVEVPVVVEASPSVVEAPVEKLAPIVNTQVPVEVPASTEIVPVRVPHPYENFMEEAHITAMKLREENEAKVRKVEDHWRNQLLSITNQYDQLKQVNEEEYLAAIAKVKSYYAGMESVEAVCGDKKDCLLKCYRDNKDRSLLCSDEVNKFEAY